MRPNLFVQTIISSLMLSVPAYATVGVATIKATADGSAVSGEVTITETDTGIEVEAKVENVPAGKHGFHFHEVGDCGDAGNAAGGHFNPDKTKHGFLPQDGHQNAHLGDMGNIEVTADGTGSLKQFLPGVYLSKTPSIGGRSVILHEKEDDFGQPTGNAGGRIGCGIVELKDAAADSADDPSANMPEAELGLPEVPSKDMK